MRLKIHTPFLLSVICLSLLGCLLVPQAGAYPSLYTARCATCHTDDTPSCDGCHEHRGNLSASSPMILLKDGSCRR